MVKVVRIQYEHVEKVIAKDPRSTYLKGTVTPEILESKRYAYTILEGDEPIMLAGLAIYWTDRAETWAIIDHEKAGKHFVQIHKIVKRFLEIVPVKRIEAAVEIGHPEAHRWVKLLGFELEAPIMKSFCDGRDHSLYALVKNG